MVNRKIVIIFAASIAENCAFGHSEGQGCIFMEKRLLKRLFAAIQNFATSEKSSREQRDGRCSLGMIYTPLPIYIGTQGNRIYIFGVDSGVARSVGLGNAKALYSGMSDEVQTLTLFSYLWKPETTIDNLSWQRSRFDA